MRRLLLRWLLCAAAAAAILSVYVLQQIVIGAFWPTSAAGGGDAGHEGPYHSYLYRDRPKSNDEHSIGRTPRRRRAGGGMETDEEQLLHALPPPTKFDAAKDDDNGRISRHEMEILRRSPARRPGYAANSNSTYFGYVMRDLAARLLSRHTIVEGEDSNVLVVSKDFVSSSSSRQQVFTTSPTIEELIVNASVGPSFVRYATKEGHQVHSVGISNGRDATNELTAWWEAQGSSVSGPPRSIRLALFDPPAGSENALASEVVSRILSKVSIKYIIFRVSASGMVTKYGDNEFIFSGVESVISLADMDYKISLLSSSHSLKWFQPNALIGRDSASEFLRRGAGKAAETGDGTFTSYLFATKGLDLAIPSQREYIATLSAGKVRVDKSTGDCILSLKSCKSEARLEFSVGAGGEKLSAIASNRSNLSAKELFGGVSVFCANKAVVDPNRIDRVWISGSSIEVSEAVCVHINNCGGKRGASACATRIITPTETHKASHQESKETPSRPPNLLLVDIDSMSRRLFDQTLPGTRDLLDYLGFASFDRYTPTTLLDQNMTFQSNHWIWDDLRDRGYAMFRAEDRCVRKGDLAPSLAPNATHGSALHEMHCFDFERPNCIAGKPAASHLSRHAAQFMTEYGQKGSRPWAAILSFTDSQEDTNVLAAALDEPIASFLAAWRNGRPRDFDNTLVVVVSNRGLTHGSYVQTRQGRQERANPILFMKLPLSYNNEDARNALRANKDLWISPLDAYATFRHVLFKEGKGLGLGSYQRVNAEGLSLLNRLPDERQECRGSRATPQYLCDILDQKRPDDEYNNDTTEMVSPASMLSYYADIPRSQKETREMCPEGNPLSGAELHDSTFVSPCKCATSHRGWYDCLHHPWKGNSKTVEFSHEYFAFVDCPNRTLSFETRVERDPSLVRRSQEERSKENGGLPPNILFIEVDSASVAYADRHLPQTREFLSEHRIEENNDRGKLVCKSSICAVDLSNRFTVTGPNSISNQVSALAGCVTSHPDEECRTTSQDGLCNDPGALEYNLRHRITFLNASVWCPNTSNANHNAKGSGSSHFLFDIARDMGYVTFFGEEFCFDHSPYVTQGNIFDLNADIKVHTAHCRIAERYLMQQNLTINPKKLWSGTGFHLPCVDGDQGLEKSLISTESILQMWSKYSDRPRFAFLNAMAAHDYAPRWEAMTQKAETYDFVLSSFLRKLLSRPGASNTIVVLRSDHGLQDGPSTADFSTQAEHSRPWTEIILPQSLSEISLEVLKKNQERLASGFDLYHTLRSIMTSPLNNVMTGSSTSGGFVQPPVPPWSINLLTQEIPVGRTCFEGRIPAELCRNENEKTFIAPSFGTCNKFDRVLHFFCPKRSAGGITNKVRVELLLDMGQQVKTPNRKKNGKRANRRRGFVGKVRNKYSTKKQTGRWFPESQPLLPKELKSSWQLIDEIVEGFPRTKVSGGIFLYPRQSALITAIVEKLGRVLDVSHPGRPLRICETGFGAGHSAALFLAASNSTVVYSFDRFDRPYQRPAADFISKQYPGRFVTITGDSCNTVPATLSSEWDPEPDIAQRGGDPMINERIQCDILHGSSLCKSDNIDLVHNSPPGALLTSTSMGSLVDEEVYFGPKAQWTKLRAQECISNITCFDEEEMELNRTFIFSRQGNKIYHKFCMAIVTERCTKGFNDGIDAPAFRESQLFTITQTLDLKNMCPQHQVPTPGTATYKMYGRT